MVDEEVDEVVEEEAEEDGQLFRGMTQMNPMPDPLSCSRPASFPLLATSPLQNTTASSASSSFATKSTHRLSTHLSEPPSSTQLLLEKSTAATK